MTSFLAPDCLAVAREALEEMSSNPGRIVRAELRVRHKDGSYLDMEVRGRSLLGDPDVEGVVVAAHDITGRRRSSEENARLIRAESSRATSVARCET